MVYVAQVHVDFSSQFLWVFARIEQTTVPRDWKSEYITSYVGVLVFAPTAGPRGGVFQSLQERSGQRVSRKTSEQIENAKMIYGYTAITQSRVASHNFKLKKWGRVVDILRLESDSLSMMPRSDVIKLAKKRVSLGESE